MVFLIQYQEQVLTPYMWINQADELIAASKKLEPSIKKYWETTKKFFDPKKGTYSPPPEYKPKRLLQGTYFMLVAYSIENYFKAILIADSEAAYRSEIFRTGALPKDLNEHNLIKLAEISKFVFTDIERSLLIRLSRNSTWQGRYPVPAHADRLNSMVSSNGKDFFTAFLSPADINNLTILVRRIKKFSATRVSDSQQLNLPN